MTPNQNSVVVGVFEDRSMAEHAVDQLKQAGFEDDQIGFAVRNAQPGEGVATDEPMNDTAGGAVTGAVSGGVLGGIIGAAASLLIPGFGPVLAGGILAATLSGAVIGAAAGGILGALTKLGVPKEEAEYYEGEFKAGRTIVTVQPNGRQQEALDILRRNGAYDANTRPADAMSGDAYQTTDYNTATGRSTMMNLGNMNQNQQGQYTNGSWEDVSPQYKEYWTKNYGSNKGEKWQDYEPAYRYAWEMKNNPQYQSMSWSEAEPYLKRDWETRYPNKPWNKTSNMLKETWESDMGYGFQGMGDQQTRSVPIREEQLSATKQPTQTGEVRIGKDVVTEEKTINVPVKREQVYVEQRDVAARPSDRPISDQGDTISVPVVEEQVNIQKQPVVTGEVRIGKQQTQDTEQYTDTVKREEPRIEREGDVNIEGTDTDQFDREQY